MKKTTLFLILFLPAVLVHAQQQYTITGTVPVEYNGSFVGLSELDPYDPINATRIPIDSAYISDGQFSFKGELPAEAILCMVTLNNISGIFVLDNEPLRATYVENNQFGYFHISGSTLNKDLSRIIEFPYKKQTEVTATAKKRTELLAKNEWTLADEDAARENQRKAAVDYVESVNQFVKSNITNPAGQYLYMLYGLLIKKEIKDEVEAKLSEDIKQKLTTGRQEVTKMMKGFQAVASNGNQIKTGDKYVDFKGELPSGETTNLSAAISSKKLILLDFWASWCVPCLKEMPEIINLHNKYKGQGFQIVGISLDTNREEWKDAIESIGMPWVQFIDSNLSNPISGIYGANAIPHTVLIDEQGDIVAVGLRGEELHNRIAELLAE